MKSAVTAALSPVDAGVSTQSVCQHFPDVIFSWRFPMGRWASVALRWPFCRSARNEHSLCCMSVMSPAQLEKPAGLCVCDWVAGPQARLQSLRIAAALLL